jgi:hypothetical protein
MWVNQNSFYFATLRKVTVAFGSLFNNIHIQRFDQPGGKGNQLRRKKVPLEYAAGQKWWIKRVKDIAAQGGVQTKTSFPRIAFEMTGLQYDPARQIPDNLSCPKPDPENAGDYLRQLNPVPYDIQFEVMIALKNIDDGLQIVEQIVPYFRPQQNLTIDDIPELQISKDVPIILGGINMNDDYEGPFDTERVTIWSLSFVVKAYLYPPISSGDQDLIRKVLTSLYKDPAMTSKHEVIIDQVDPIDAAFGDDWSQNTTIYGEALLDSNGDPIISDSVIVDSMPFTYTLNDANAYPTSVSVDSMQFTYIVNVTSLIPSISVNSMAFNSTFNDVTLTNNDSAFLPTDLAGLQIWLDASDETTIFDTAGSVYRWEDKSGNDYHATQATGANQPSTGDDVINSLNVLTYPTRGEYLLANDLTSVFDDTNSYTTFVVSYNNSTSGTHYNYRASNSSGQIRHYTGKSNTSFVMQVGNSTTPTNVATTGDDSTHIFLANRGAQADFYIDGGASEGSTTLGSSFTTSEVRIGSNADLLMAETLIFNRALTVAEMNQVGNYLADKWGLTWTDIVFTPAVLAPSIWLDASDETTIFDTAGAVYRWEDKSGNENHLLQATGANQPVTGATTRNSKNVIDFSDDSSDDFLILESNPVTDTTATIIEVYKNNSAANSVTIHGLGTPYTLIQQDGSSSTGLLNSMANAGTEIFYDGNNELVDGVDTRDDVHTALVGDFHIVVHRDVTLASFTDMYIGGYGSGFSLDGSYAELLIYDSDLSNSDLNDVLDYLSAKWDITTTEIGSFTPSDISNLQLWLDASDESTIFNTAGSVYRWEDKSGNDHHLVQATGASQPTTSSRTHNSLNVIDFDGSNHLTNTFSSTLSQPYTIFFVGESDIVTTSYFYDGIDGSNRGGFGLDASQIDWFSFGGAALYSGVGRDTDPHVFGALYNATSSDNYVDGTPSDAGYKQAGTHSLTGLTVGGRYSLSNFMDGWIGEMLLYEGNLSTEDKNLIGNYLADKWNLTWTDIT